MTQIFEPIEFLSRMIAIPSVSRQEGNVANLVEQEMIRLGFDYNRCGNNLWVVHPSYDSSRPTLLLNSHLDTVRPATTWTRDPYLPAIIDGRLYGLGSNDAGASAACLLGAFYHIYQEEYPLNLILALTAEEEVMGEGGMRMFLPQLIERGYKIDMALVGEPTGMQPAIAERGLLVLDCVSHGVSGHAARNEGVNALYKAISEIEFLKNFKFDRESRILGPIKISVTMIEAGTQHNVVPDICKWVVDVRTTDVYNNEETVKILKDVIESDITPRSTRIWASVIEESHPLVITAKEIGGQPFVSPTTSDMALLHDIPSLKMGPGQSSRSHTADEFVLIDEVQGGIKGYIQFLKNLAKRYKS